MRGLAARLNLRRDGDRSNDSRWGSLWTTSFGDLLCGAQARRNTSITLTVVALAGQKTLIHNLAVHFLKYYLSGRLGVTSSLEEDHTSTCIQRL